MGAHDLLKLKVQLLPTVRNLDEAQFGKALDQLPGYDWFKLRHRQVKCPACSAFGMSSI